MNGSGIICAGNWIVDLVHAVDHWPRESDLVRIGQQNKGIGGGAANVITVLQRLKTGLPLWPMGAVGDDDYGAYILSCCADIGLDSDFFAIKPGVPTAHTHVMSVTGESRTFFYQGGANDVLGPADFVPGTFRRLQARVFYLGYLTLLAALEGAGGHDVLARARAAGMLTCVDLVSVDRPDFAQTLAPALPQIDYLILNEVEAARAVGQAVPPADCAPDDDQLIAMGQALIAAGVQRAVVIHCPQKACWIGADGRHVIRPADPLPRADIVSPLGAGDAFCAGAVYAVHEGWSPDRTLALGHAVARASLRGVTAAEAVPPLADIKLADHAAM